MNANEMDEKRAQAVLEQLLSELDIPTSLYVRAEERYQALAKWYHRSASSVAEYDCKVYPQGSFRLGTVIRPLDANEEYDLDLVCGVGISKMTASQHDLKNMVGTETKAYAESMNITAPVEEKSRCWRLKYADEASFHMDILPAIPEDRKIVEQLVNVGIDAALAQHAVAITDLDDPNYDAVCDTWPTSNPKGYARWFEDRMRDAALGYLNSLVESAEYRSTDDVPAYRWKTPLQLVVQILKRHRDVMFKEASDVKPISMIITTLAAHSYEGEASVIEALRSIVVRMQGFIHPESPRIPNPVNPDEDFTDAWSDDPRLEEAFASWHAQLTADVAKFVHLQSLDDARRLLKEAFDVEIGAKNLRHLFDAVPSVSVLERGSRTSRIASNAPKPWGSCNP